MKTVGDVVPAEVIGAVFRFGESNIVEHLGTGSIVGDGTIVLTAEHVIRDNTEALAFAITIDNRPLLLRLTVVESDWQSDLALLRIHGYRAPNPLRPLFDTNLSTNIDLVTLEYAQTMSTAAGWDLNPALRRGHKVRTINTDKMAPISGKDALELSFPALKFASGAPVMIENMPWDQVRDIAWGIVGVLVGNIGYETIPAQIITLLGDEDKYIEERQYMLPQGLAVDINHLRPMYERVMGIH